MPADVVGAWCACGPTVRRSMTPRLESCSSRISSVRAWSMDESLEFLLGLFDRESPAFVAAEDVTGIHREAVRRWIDRGFIAVQPELHTTPSCPECLVGAPAAVNGRLVCSFCFANVPTVAL